MLLARQGHDVLLVDRATFPSDNPHGHLIHRHGPARLAGWGPLDRILATNCRLLGVFVGWAAPQLSAVRAIVEARFMAVIDSVEGLSARLRGGRRVERVLGATDLPNFFRTPGGPGWALVGDAGCHKDPVLALGICDAAAMPDYETNVRAASFEPLQREDQRLREALRGNEADTAKFLMATIGMIPAESFFQISNIRRIIGRGRGGVYRTRP
jgi:flavin-dependent dehydrogenase